MDMNKLSLIPHLLSIIEHSERFIKEVEQEFFTKLGIVQDARGDVELRYLENPWYRQAGTASQYPMLYIQEQNGTPKGIYVVTEDTSTSIGSYVVFKWVSTHSVRIVVLDPSREIKAPQ